MIISFAWTVDPLLAGIKTVTRRDWKPRHMATWQRAWDEGRRIHDAWDKVPFAGGRWIGKIRLTCRPYWERLGDMPAEDLVAEGGLWDSLEEFVELQGGDPDKMMAVVRLELET